jgi:NADPH-dependent 2,4-dienoyl-CoA reductase/sulfur reductase-like enzyme
MSSTPETEMQSAVESPVEYIKAEAYKWTAKPKAPLTAEERANMDKPKVLIVGAGLGGLMLGNLLHKAKIPFTIFERAKEVKNLGKAAVTKNESLPLLAKKGI